MTKKIFILFVIAAVFILVGLLLNRNPGKVTIIPKVKNLVIEDNPLYIENIRKQDYPGSAITITQTLSSGVNYKRYIASYSSDTLKIYGLYPVPNAVPGENGYPAIVLLHGYLDPKTYITTQRYVAYQDQLARNGFVTFKPDLRGHGESEGEAIQANFSTGYVTDTLNLISSLQKEEIVNPEKIGIWGHSMGGGIALRTMVTTDKIKAAVIWAGVVGTYEDLLDRYRNRVPWVRNDLIEKYASPSVNPAFWNKVDPYTYFESLTTPIALHHTVEDESVPVEFSRNLKTKLESLGKSVEYFEYQNSDHNLSNPAFGLAMDRTVAFFKKHLQEPAFNAETPFISQAPYGEWKDPRHQDGCEEAATLIAVSWAKTLDLDKDIAKREILSASGFQSQKYGEYRDASAADTAKRLLKEYFRFENFKVEKEVTLPRLVEILKSGKIIVAPTNGRVLRNPGYTPPGPERHMVVILGYDPQTREFITHDPGVGNGAYYHYPKEVLYNAIRDYSTGYHIPITETLKNVIIVSHEAG